MELGMNELLGFLVSLTEFIDQKNTQLITWTVWTTVDW